jgi:hypothetical protein
MVWVTSKSSWHKLKFNRQRIAGRSIFDGDPYDPP